MGQFQPPLFEEHAELHRVAVCRPTYFRLGAAINVIQAAEVARGARIAAPLADDQHAALVAALEAAGAEVVQITPNPSHPYQLNARDAGLATSAGLVLARFRLPIRQGEEQLALAAAAEQAVPILGAVSRAAFEGGDFVALGPFLGAVGLGPRTEATALAELRALLGRGVELLGVPFADRFLHLDMILNVVAPGLALACPEALPPDLLASVAARFRVIPISESEVFQHAANVLPLGRGRVLSHAANPRINAALRAEGLEVVEVDVSELARSGGGPRCLTLPLERAVTAA